MKKLQLKNFRSIRDSGEIEIKPITVLLGKNSCGKSSFIRMFPLIKQSLEKNRQDPLLWFGDYVDFGSFEEVLPKGQTEEKDLTIAFDMDLLKNDEDVRYYRNLGTFKYFKHLNLQKTENMSVHVIIHFKQKHISSYTVKFLNQEVSVKINNNEIEQCVINDDYNLNLDCYTLHDSSKYLLPNILYVRKGKDEFVRYFDAQEDELKPIKNIFMRELGVKLKEETFDTYIGKLIKIQSQKTLLDNLKKLSGCAAVKKYFADKNCDDSLFKEINNLIVLIIVSSIIDQINIQIEDEFCNTFYLKPLRAQANRYYRVQGISVKSVDADGSNLPMVLYNMTGDQRKSFSDWCNEKLGLCFSIKKQEGHVSLMVKVGDDCEINLADTGYGYSQVLPIILQLWLVIERNKLDVKEKMHNNYTIVIEQPELHLHPAFQSKLMEVFVALVDLAKDSGNSIKIIFETHSEHMVNGLGRLISAKKIKKDDINIVLVSKENNISNFKQTCFDENGFIEEWPIGFMSPED